MTGNHSSDDNSQTNKNGLSACSFFRKTLDALPANIAILDVNGKIVLVNKAWRQFAERNGVSTEKVSEGINYLQVCDEASGKYSKGAESFAMGIRKVFSGKKESYSREYPCHSPEEKRWFIGNVAPFHDHDCRALVVHVDITELKLARLSLQKVARTLEQRVVERTRQVEERTRKLQLLSMELIEAVEGERSRLAQLLHDDLQQMLASARMQLQLLQQNEHYSSALTYVEQLLEESIQKSRSIAYQLSPPVLHNSDLVTALQWLFRKMTEQFGLQVHFSVDKPPPFEREPLKLFLFRAAQELLANVAKHSGGKIAWVKLTSDLDEVSLTISDRGRGFNPDIIDTNDMRPGFGLLSLRERTGYMGGRFVIESAPSKGCQTTITIPLCLPGNGRTCPKVEEEEDSIGMPAAAIRVMLADDHIVMRQGLNRLISGHSDIQIVGEAANGREAVEQALTLKPDVVVMDINMPEMDGIAATRHILAEMPKVLVIGLSLHDDEQLCQKMRLAGAKRLLNKSTSSTALLKAIYDFRR